jgi:hypothetical protein
MLAACGVLQAQVVVACRQRGVLVVPDVHLPGGQPRGASSSTCRPFSEKMVVSFVGLSEVVVGHLWVGASAVFRLALRKGCGLCAVGDTVGLVYTRSEAVWHRSRAGAHVIGRSLPLSVRERGSGGQDEPDNCVVDSSMSSVVAMTSWYMLQLRGLERYARPLRGGATFGCDFAQRWGDG